MVTLGALENVNMNVYKRWKNTNTKLLAGEIQLIVGGCAGSYINYTSCCLKHSDKIRPNDRGRNTQGTSRDDINKTEKYSDCSEIQWE